MDDDETLICDNCGNDGRPGEGVAPWLVVPGVEFNERTMSFLCWPCGEAANRSDEGTLAVRREMLRSTG